MFRENCPLCEANTLDTNFHSVQVQSVIDIPAQEMKISLCESCGHVFQNPVLEDLLSIDHYENHSNYTLLPTDQMLAAKRNQVGWVDSIYGVQGLEHLVRTLGHKRELFEIGASSGAFLNIARESDWGVSGIEPAQAATDEARRTYGISITRADLDQLDVIDSPVVFMSHVVEHFPDPVAALKRIHDITDELAIAFIEVPDFSYPRDSVGCGYFINEHISYFTASTLSLLMQKTGWVPLDIRTHQYKDAAEFCAYPVLRGVFLKKSRSVLRQFRSNALQLTLQEDVLQEQRIRSSLDKFAQECAEIAIFGAGGHTSMLLDFMDGSAKKRIRGIFDSSENKIGSTLEGFKIRGPDGLKEVRDCGIIISSQGYQSQMVDQVRALLGPDVRLLTFY